MYSASQRFVSPWRAARVRNFWLEQAMTPSFTVEPNSEENAVVFEDKQASQITAVAVVGETRMSEWRIPPAG